MNITYANIKKQLTKPIFQTATSSGLLKIRYEYIYNKCILSLDIPVHTYPDEELELDDKQKEQEDTDSLYSFKLCEYSVLSITPLYIKDMYV